MAEVRIKSCEQCSQKFAGAETTTVCAACSNWRIQAEHWCERCKKTFKWADVHFVHNHYTGENAKATLGTQRSLEDARATLNTHLISFHVIQRMDKPCAVLYPPTTRFRQLLLGRQISSPEGQPPSSSEHAPSKFWLPFCHSSR